MSRCHHAGLKIDGGVKDWMKEQNEQSVAKHTPNSIFFTIPPCSRTLIYLELRSPNRYVIIFSQHVKFANIKGIAFFSTTIGIANHTRTIIKTYILENMYLILSKKARTAG
jgi:hypothetical protein